MGTIEARLLGISKHFVYKNRFITYRYKNNTTVSSDG